MILKRARTDGEHEFNTPSKASKSKTRWMQVGSSTIKEDFDLPKSNAKSSTKSRK